jgi:hypothetical protein
MSEDEVKPEHQSTPDDNPTPAKVSRAQWQMIAIIVAFAAGSVVYRLLMDHGLGHSAAMFIGIPSLIAALLALTPKARTLTGGILKGITLALLIVAPLMGEGYLCILMASPLFYLAGTIIGVVLDENRKKRNVRIGCLVLVLVPMSLEGISPELSFRRAQMVEATQTVDATPDQVRRQLAQSPNLDAALPRVLRIGFPVPLMAWGQGLEVGTTRTIHFTGAEGDPPGDLIMRVAALGPGYIRFATVSDSSKLTQWIGWDNSEVEWRPLDANHTQVTWRVQFERKLDPAWYFAPLERVAVHQAAKYLIAANATPVSTPQPTEGSK